jgi:hypothetical protein
VRSDDDAPMVRGRMTDVQCTIVPRHRAHEATTLCRGAFVVPGKATRRVVARFARGGTWSLNSDCSERWATSPYCAGKGRMATTSDG